ncbi:hypothetical protein [Nocardioides sp.]|uniref:hypothetical protein n=1 Tax=Nocardioides sp. TaxID=35761 RepID=UPI002C26E346|nr:hypothetical protein [Nocardioides sp.]HXH78956.1 hypothetical protein [Nocardioides sp.]
MPVATIAPPLGFVPADGFGDLDAAATLAVAESTMRARREAEVHDLLVVAHWADLHSDPPAEDPDRPAHARERMIQPGGDGTPAMREFALAELAWAKEIHHATLRSQVADILDLRHRLPLTFQVMLGLRCEPWVARKVASITRHLDRERVGIVDRAVAPAIAGESPAVLLELTRAKSIEADPEHEKDRLDFERRRRYVALSRSDASGFRNVIARVTDGDAVWIDAMVDRVADILALTPGGDHNRDELRSLAMGWLVRPADLLQLLVSHTAPSADETAPVWEPTHTSDTLARLAALTPRQLAALRPKAVAHVHLTDEALRTRSGVARVEDLGPQLVERLAELLGHADVRLQPVRDLNGRIRVDQYEHPDALKDHAWHLSGGDAFPYTPPANRAVVDHDHPTPYDKDGPPGQTGNHNSAPLRRTHHRWKTFGGYRCRQAGPGRYLWATPHGHYYLRDHTGTHHLDPDDGELILEAPPGVDIYPC